jgi:hypothetical protein
LQRFVREEMCRRDVLHQRDHIMEPNLAGHSQITNEPLLASPISPRHGKTISRVPASHAE